MKLDTSTELVLIGWTSWKGRVTSEECANKKGEGVKEKKKEDGRKLVHQEQRGGRGKAAVPDDIPFL